MRERLFICINNLLFTLCDFVFAVIASEHSKRYV